jgi:GNAT superfamily N-acetyltransferase
MESLTIRELRSEDIDEFVNVLMRVYENKFKVIFKSKMREGRNSLFQEMKTRKSLEGNFIAIVNGLTVGAAILKTREMQQNFFQTLKIFLKNLGIYNGLRAFFIGGFHQSILEKFISKDGCYVENLFILTEFRKRGIGKQLMQRVEEFAREKNKKFMYGFAEISNISARKLDTKFGFREIQIKKNILTKIFFGVPAWVYEKKSLDTEK